MALKSWAAETDLVVVNRPPRPESDRVVLTADRGKFWLAGDSPVWPAASRPVRGRGRISFWPGHLRGELISWQPAAAADLRPPAAVMVDDWLDWLNRQLEVAAISRLANPDLETSHFWRIFEEALGLAQTRRPPELAGAYFYLRVFELTGQSFQLAESSGRQPLAGERFHFNFEQCCFEPSPGGRYSQRHIKLLRCLAAVEPRLLARIAAPGRLLAEIWQLIQGHPGYSVSRTS